MKHVTKTYMHDGKEMSRNMSFDDASWEQIVKQKPEPGVKWELRKIEPVPMKTVKLGGGSDLNELKPNEQPEPEQEVEVSVEADTAPGPEAEAEPEPEVGGKKRKDKKK